MARSSVILHHTIAMLAAALAAAGCGDQEDKNATGGKATTGGQDGKTPGRMDNPLPSLSDLAPGWTRIEPGGGTGCGNGSPYAFFVRPGTVNRVLINFSGGGACWSENTCVNARKLFQEKIDEDPFLKDEKLAQGIFNHANMENPFKDWHHVYISYCTGDVHWGNNDQMYYDGTPVQKTIHHRGAVNARAALDWTYNNITAPEKAFVTGCSAGAYGAIMWSAHVRKRYEGTKVYELGDSGAGIITEKFFQESYPSWRPGGAYPKWIPEASPPVKIKSLADLYIAIGGYYPDMPIGQYSTKRDELQVRYFTEMGGGSADEWSTQMEASLKKIEAETPSFRSYIAPGDVHCILPRDELYTLEVCGKKVVSWISDQVNDQPVKSINADECSEH